MNTDIVEREINRIERENPLLKKLNKIPGETFRLPSRGIFYNNGELDPEVKDAEIQVHPMTTIDELMLRSPDMLFQGTAIETVFKRLIPQVLKPLELLSGDVDFLLTCLRKVSYGEVIPIKHVCTKCLSNSKSDEDKPNPLSYDIPINHFFKNCKEFSQETYKNLVLDIEDFKIKLRPATFKQMIKIYESISKLNNFDSIEETMDFIVINLCSVIEKVDNISDKEMIGEWIRRLPRANIKIISDRIADINNWGVEFKYNLTCKTCKNVDEITTGLNPTTFFTSP